MASLFLLHYAVDEVFEFGISRAALDLAVKIVIPNGKQAGADFAVGGEAYPAAMSAEGMRHWGDDADFATAIVEAIAARSLGARVRDLDQQAIFAHAS